MPSEKEMLEAVKQADASLVEKLLREDPSLVNAKTDSGESATLRAIYLGHREVAEILLRNKPALTIFEAAAAGQLARVQELTQQAPETINHFSHDGWTPLHLAAYFGHKPVVDFLLARQAQVDPISKNALQVTPLQSALANSEIAAAQVLIERGASVNRRPGASDWSPLHYAAANGLPETAKLLLERGADANPRLNDGKTPLTVALDNGNYEVEEIIRSRQGVE